MAKNITYRFIRSKSLGAVQFCEATCNTKVTSALAVPFTCWRRLTTLSAQTKQFVPIQLFSKLNCSGQKGFSMVEMLLAAFILAIGILGLAMLQAMSLRASRESANVVTATRIAEQIMDRAQQEGRLTWLHITEAKIVPTGIDFKYLTERQGEKFNIKGDPVNPDDPDPAVSVPVFEVATRLENVAPSGNGSIGMSDFFIQVKFSDNTNRDGEPITRTFNLTRRIIHG